MGAGAAEGAMDASNMLKPMLARGELRCDRRDHARRVPQAHREGRGARAAVPAGPGGRADGRGHDRDPARPARSATRSTTACGSGSRALVAAATLSDRYITDRFLPDKAIDLVDEARQPAPDGDRLDAGRARRARAPADPAGDRARGAPEGDRRRVEDAAGRLEKELADLEEAAGGHEAALGGGEGGDRRDPGHQVGDRAAPGREIEQARAGGGLRPRPRSSSTARAASWRSG